MTLSFPRLPLLARSIVPPFLATSALLVGAGPATAADGATGGHVLKQSTLLADEARLTNGPLMTAIKRAIATLPNEQVEAIVPNRSANPANVRRVERLMSSADWDYLFPLRAPEYTYGGFLRAIGKFPAVCGDYADGRDADAICRKTLATMFAHFAQETGAHESYRPEPEWRQGLRWVREMGWTEDMRGGYNGECNPWAFRGWVQVGIDPGLAVINDWTWSSLASPRRGQLGSWGRMGSMHSNGAHAALGDGSVHFLNENTPLTMLQNLAAMADGSSVFIP